MDNSEESDSDEDDSNFIVTNRDKLPPQAFPEIVTDRKQSKGPMNSPTKKINVHKDIKKSKSKKTGTKNRSDIRHIHGSNSSQHNINSSSPAKKTPKYKK